MFEFIKDLIKVGCSLAVLLSSLYLGLLFLVVVFTIIGNPTTLALVILAVIICVLVDAIYNFVDSL